MSVKRKINQQLQIKKEITEEESKSEPGINTGYMKGNKPKGQSRRWNPRGLAGSNTISSSKEEG